MSTIFYSVVPTVCVLGILIFIHELGHFICAKLSGVFVEKFSIGFGPEILKFKKGDTVYAVSLVPLGGFVKMGGETMDERQGAPMRADDFLAQSRWKRFLILFAGPFMNYFLAFFLLFVVFMVGAPTLTPTIGQILENSPAQKNGLMSGDKILKVNGTPVKKWEEMTEFIAGSNGLPMQFDLERNGSSISIVFPAEKTERTDLFGDKHTTYQIGIASAGDIIYEKVGFVGALKGSTKSLWDLTTMTVKSLYRLVTGRLSLKTMSGPLGIVDMASRTAKQGIIPLLQLTAYLSVFLAVFNLLPFPALDGGHLFFLLIESIFNKPVKYHVQERFAQVGFLLLMILMLVVLYNDMDRFGWISKIKGFIFQ